MALKFLESFGIFIILGVAFQTGGTNSYTKDLGGKILTISIIGAIISAIFWIWS